MLFLSSVKTYSLSRTQQLLSKLKESTAALEDMSQQKPTSFGGRPPYGEPRFNTLRLFYLISNGSEFFTLLSI